MLRSDIVKPFRVAESPVQFECKVIKVEALGTEGGAGNLIFSEVVKIHVDESILDATGAIDQHKIDQVARMGGNWYSRANMGMFEVPKPLSSLGMGIDNIPEEIRHSSVLTGNDLGMLGNVEHIPTADEVKEFVDANVSIRSILSGDNKEKLHKKAQEFLHNNEVHSAWKVLLANK